MKSWRIDPGTVLRTVLGLVRGGWVSYILRDVVSGVTEPVLVGSGPDDLRLGGGRSRIRTGERIWILSGAQRNRGRTRPHDCSHGDCGRGPDGRIDFEVGLTALDPSSVLASGSLGRRP
jgi:hypothetical protein